MKPSALHVLHHNFAITIRMVLSKNLLLLLEKISRKGLRRSGYIIYAEALYPKNVAGLKLRPKVRKEEGGVDNGNGSDYYVWPFCFKYVSSTTALENIL